MTTIGQGWDRGANNFDALRITAAFAVIVSHAFYLQHGLSADEPLAGLTGLPLGWHAVQVFFIMSGFLVLASFERHRALGAFLLARALRIMPALVCAVLFSVLVVGPLATTLPLADYAASSGIALFIFDALILLDGNIGLPGVFQTLPDQEVIGTVWTLRYEILCYLGLAAAGWLGLTRRSLFYVAAGAGLLLIGTLVWYRPEITEKFGVIQHLLRLGGCFLLGMMAWHWRERIPLHLGGVVILAAVVVLLRETMFFRPALYVAEAYGVMWLAFAASATPLPRLPFDYSYGLYLFGFPIQQLVRLWLPDSSPLFQLAIALPFALLLAAASWHLVEKPCLALKTWRSPRAAGAMAAQ